MENKTLSKTDWSIIFLVGFGYFVDIYDLLLFSVVRSKSLSDIGITDANLLTHYGVKLIDITVWGMLLGSFLWGILSDRFGRKSILIASIITYSIGNLLCAFVHDINLYFIFRFITGVGIAGELGAGLALVSENVDKNKRSIATTIIGAIGMLGAITAALTGKLIFWRYAYVLGTVFGVLLLIFRLNVSESIIYLKSSTTTNRGNLLKLITTGKSLKKYLLGILVGLNIFFIIGAYVSLSPELGNIYNLSISAGDSVIVCYLTIFFFDLIAGYLSYKSKSRKKVLYLFLIIQLIGTLVFYYTPVSSSFGFFLKLSFLCSGVGMWLVLNTFIAELFGTDIRGTVSVTTPNIIRWLFSISSSILLLIKPKFGVLNAVTIISVVSILISIIALSFLSDKFENDTDFLEFK